MKPRLLAVLLVAVACDPLPALAPRRHDLAAIRVVTWNVHDLFDAEDDLVPPGELDLVPSAAAVAAKLDLVSAVLARLDADVVLLQEVETHALAAALAERSGYAEARLVEAADPRGIDVAALSRLPVLAYVSHRDDRRTDGHPLWPRDCVELHVTAGRRRVALVMSHFSSALSDDGTRRAEQAARMRALADGLGVAHPDALVLAGGDLNDSPGSPALAPLLQDGEWHEVVAPAAWTWSSGSRGARLDYLLVAREDMGAVLQGAVVEGTDVLEASDHRPVVADLRIF